MICQPLSSPCLETPGMKNINYQHLGHFIVTLVNGGHNKEHGQLRILEDELPGRVQSDSIEADYYLCNFTVPQVPKTKFNIYFAYSGRRRQIFFQYLYLYKRLLDMLQPSPCY